MTQPNAITPAVWQRMPWHARARAASRLDAEVRALTRERDAIRQLTKEMRADLLRIAAIERAWRPTAEAQLALLPVDPDAARHRAELLAGLGYCTRDDCGRRIDDKGRCSRHDWKHRRIERAEKAS